MAECLALNKIFMLFSLEFGEHCRKGGGKNVRTRKWGEELQNAICNWPYQLSVMGGSRIHGALPCPDNCCQLTVSGRRKTLSLVLDSLVNFSGSSGWFQAHGNTDNLGSSHLITKPKDIWQRDL